MSYKTLSAGNRIPSIDSVYAFLSAMACATHFKDFAIVYMYHSFYVSEYTVAHQGHNCFDTSDTE